VPPLRLMSCLSHGLEQMKSAIIAPAVAAILFAQVIDGVAHSFFVVAVFTATLPAIVRMISGLVGRWVFDTSGLAHHPRSSTTTGWPETAVAHINIVMITAEARHHAHVAPMTNGSRNVR
jgi:hypothetical protein